MAKPRKENIGDKFLNLFGLRQGEGISQRMAQVGSGMSASVFGSMSNMFQLSEDRVVAYRDFEKMDTFSDTSVALDIYGEEASQRDPEEGASVWVKGPADVVEHLEDLFKKIDIENNLWGWARHLAKYGDMFFYLIVNGEEGVTDIQYMHPQQVDIVKDASNKNKIIGYKCDTMHRAMIANTWFEPPRDGEGRTLYDLWEFVHFRIPGSDLASPYGRSMLASARYAWMQLEMLETALAIYRLHRAGTRLVYYVDVGAAVGDEARDIVENFRRGLKNKEYLKVGSAGGNQSFAEYLSKYNPFNLIEDIFWPTNENDRSKVEPLNADTEVRAIADVERFVTKLRTALGIPKAYFDGDISGWAANKALARQDLRFSEKIWRLQQSIIAGLDVLCRIHLTFLGYNAEEIQFEIQMTPVSDLAELQGFEMMTQRIAMTSSLVGLTLPLLLDQRAIAEWCMVNIMNWDQKTIDSLRSQTPESLMSMPPSPPAPADPYSVGPNVMTLPESVSSKKTKRWSKPRFVVETIRRARNVYETYHNEKARTLCETQPS